MQTPHRMNQKVQHIFDLAEVDRIKILNLVSGMSEEKFLQRKNRKWSVSQILSHVITAERLSLLYMKKKSLGKKDIDNAGVWEEIKFSILKISQRLPLKYKAPQVLNEEPKALPLQEIVKQWQTVRKDFAQFADSLEGEDVKKKIYKHPFAGRLNVMHAIAFFREHANHHLPQIKRLL
jgi:uncharacterized damage-inducible protein DinB